MSAFRALLRIARRDARRAKGRSALIVLMIALPVFALTFADVLGRTADPDPDEVASRTLGTAQYALSAQAPVGSGFQQAPDPTEGTVSTGVGDPEEEPVFADPAALVPPGARVLTETTASVEVATRGGAGVVGWVEVRAADPAFAGRYEVLSGRGPRAPGEVLVTPDLLERTGAAVGGRLALTSPERELRIVGTAREAGTRGAEAAYALPGALVGTPGGVREADAVTTIYAVGAPPLAWRDVLALNRQGVQAYDRTIVAHPPPRAAVPYYAATALDVAGSERVFAILAGVAILGLAGLEVVLLAGAAFAVGARRQRRSLALLAATGASARHVRLVVLAGGLVLGVAAAVAGVAGGVLAAALARAPLERYADAAFARFDVRPLELLAIASVAVVTGVLAAVVPARAAARDDVVAALGGRGTRLDRSPVRARAGGVALAVLGVAAAGAGSLWTAARQAGGLAASENYAVAAVIAGGSAMAVLGLVVLSPAVMGLAGRLGASLPAAPRLALRDAARHRARSAPAMAAVLAAVAGGAALLVVVAAMDDKDRREYQAQLPHGTAGVSLVDYGASGTGAAALHAPGPVLRAASARLPVRSAVVVPEVTDCLEDPCRMAGVRIPPANACPGGDDAGSDWRCLEAGGYGGGYALGGFVVGNAALLRALYGIDDAGARRALAAGGVVAFRRTEVRRGHVVIDVFGADAQAAPDDPDGLPEPDATVRFPAHLASAPQGTPAGAFLSPAAAARLGLHAAPAYVLLRLSRLPTQDEEDAAGAALAGTGLTAALTVERGYESDYGLGLLALVLAAAVITLGAAGIATGLAQADARDDHATLAAIGADPRLRRTLSALQALLIAGLGTGLGIAVGFVPAVALIGAVASLELTVPWLPLLFVLAGLPLLAAAGAWVCTPARLPLQRRVAG